MTESSTKRVVFFYPEKYTLPLANDKSILLDHIQLKPGANTVTLEQYDLIKAHPDFVFWSQQGAFVATMTATGEPQESELIPEPEPVPTPTPEPVPTPTPEPVPTPTPEPVPTPTPEPVPTPTPEPVPTPTPEPVPTPTPEPVPTPSQEVRSVTLAVTPGLKIMILPTLEPKTEPMSQEAQTITVTVTPGLRIVILPLSDTSTPEIALPEGEGQQHDNFTIEATQEALATTYALPDVEMTPELALEVGKGEEALATTYALPDVEMTPELALEVGSGEAEETLPKLAPDAPLPDVPRGILASQATKITSADVAKKYPKST